MNKKKNLRKPRGPIATFLTLINIVGVLAIVVSNFVSFCQLQVSTDPKNLELTQTMKDLGFAGPGFGVINGQETHEWQKNFPDKCPPPPAGYLEADVVYGNTVLPGKYWQPVPILVGLLFIDFIAFLFFLKQKGARVLQPA